MTIFLCFSIIFPICFYMLLCIYSKSINRYGTITLFNYPKWMKVGKSDWRRNLICPFAILIASTLIVRDSLKEQWLRLHAHDSDYYDHFCCLYIARNYGFEFQLLYIEICLQNRGITWRDGTKLHWNKCLQLA